MNLDKHKNDYWCSINYEEKKGGGGHAIRQSKQTNVYWLKVLIWVNKWWNWIAPNLMPGYWNEACLKPLHLQWMMTELFMQSQKS